MIDLAVRHCGMVTALGYNAPSSLAALRAGVSGIRATPWVDDESGEHLRGGKVSLPQWSHGVQHLVELLAPALAESMTPLKPDSRPRVPVLVGLPATQRPHRASRLDEEFLNLLQKKLGHALAPHSACIAADEVGPAHALLRASQLLADGATKAVVVAGVDSFLHQGVLDAYLDRRRIYTSGNSNGFFPGEAGAAVLLVSAGTARAGDLLIASLAMARETAHIESTEPLRAEALTRAMQAALNDAGVRLNEVAFRITDLTGEHYKFKEALFAAGRLNGGPRDQVLDLWHPIEYLGRIGAATLPCLLAQARHAIHTGSAPGPLALCHLGNDAGERAAAVLRACPNSEIQP